MFQIVFALVTLVASSQALSANWDQADAFYSQRSNNRSAIAQARQAYIQILNEVTSKEDKIRAVAQLGRLAIYEGEMLLPKSATTERVNVFSPLWCEKFNSLLKCVKDGDIIKHIHPRLVGENEAYYYFRGVSAAYWGEAIGGLYPAANIGILKNLIASGKQLDLRYEGGGIERLAAGIHSAPKARPLPGTYDAQLALEEITAATEREAYGDGLPGSMYFDNWRGKAVVLLQLAADAQSAGDAGKAAAYKAEAKSILQTNIEEVELLIDLEELPNGREAETIAQFEMMKSMLNEMN